MSTVVRLRGEHDASTVTMLTDTLARAMALDDSPVVVLDLSGVEFMGVATVRVILQARDLLRARSRDLLLRSPSDSARRVLEICGDMDLLAKVHSARAVDMAGRGAP